MKRQGRTAVIASLAAVLLFLLGISTQSARATLLDPTNLQMSTAGGTGSDPIRIGSVSTLDISMVGSTTIAANQLLLLLAVPQAPTNLGPPEAITGPGTSSLAYTVSTFNSNDIYTAAGLTGNGASVNNSNSFTNYQTADATYAGLSGTNKVTNFSIFVYQIDQSITGGGSAVAVSFASALPLGTFAVAFGCEGTDTLGSGTDFGGGCFDTTGAATNPEATAFTNADLITSAPSAPEASAVTLTSLVLLAFGALVVRARRHQLT